MLLLWHGLCFVRVLPHASPSGIGFFNADLTKRLPRQMDPGAQPAPGRGLQPDVPAMAARHVAGDGQAEADAAGQRVARCIEPDERPEHAGSISRRDAGSVVIDQDIDPIRCDDPR